jgi:predicted nucleic acid-binding protein
MKIDFFADTNFLIYVHEGNKITEPFLKYDFAISFVTEVELLGFKGITKREEIKLKSIINDCFLIEWSSKIKEETISLRKKYSLRLPDSIIAASAVAFEVPLVTADRGFSKIEELDLILLEV